MKKTDTGEMKVSPAQKDSKDKAGRKKPFPALRLFKELKPYYGILAVAFLGMVFVGAAQLAVPYITRWLLKLIAGADPLLTQKLVKLGLVLLGFYVLSATGQFLRSYFAHVAAWGYIDGIRMKLYAHIQNMSFGYFHDKQTGQLLSRITTDTSNIEPLVAHAIPDFLVNGILFFGSAILLFTINVKLAAITMITLPVTGVLVFIYATKFRPRFKKAHVKMGELNANIQDKLSGVREISSFNKQDECYKSVEESSKNHYKGIMSALKASAIMNPMILFNNNIGLVIVLIVGGIMAGQNNIAAADVVAFMMYVSNFYQPVISLAQIIEQFNTASTALERSYEILDSEDTIVDGTKELPPRSVKGEIEFKNVSFSYKAEEPVLKNVNLKIEAGKTFALVGPTGIGKTTMVNLISRFYDPKSGSVLLDGIDIRELTRKSLRNQVSTVLQDVFLFHGTIAENIAFGSPDGNDTPIEKIKEAAKLANADEFINDFEDGYDTIVGERGMTLSGGQKQRISIARAILRDMPVLILDEATASVDTKTERLIRDALEKLCEGRTTVIVAHRLSTVRHADQIVVLGHEGIVETGTHDELMEKQCVYYNLVTQEGI
ncbi:MAG: ABC transporter ATP-binding protein [Clostridia bacterium]|nr:ABC transporter ATP-binding protein [Clostridia bacterium]